MQAVERLPLFGILVRSENDPQVRGPGRDNEW